MRSAARRKSCLAAAQFVATWDSWMHLMRRSMASVPWLVSIGNHERGWPGSGGLFPGTDSGGECGVPYAMRFPLVSPKETEGRRGGAGIGETGRERAERLAEGREGASPMTGAIGVADAVQGRLDAQGVERAAGDEPWWSYEIGPIHMVQMSTEHDFSRGSPQHTFIEVCGTPCGTSTDSKPGLSCPRRAGVTRWAHAVCTCRERCMSETQCHSVQVQEPTQAGAVMHPGQGTITATWRSCISISCLQKDLEAVDRCRTPWVVVGGHRPFYIDSDNASPVDGDQAVSWLLRWSLESLLQ